MPLNKETKQNQTKPKKWSYIQSIHIQIIYSYVNYFDIQVLMMVTETETLTSTLHHNIFTYLDYVFSATFILSDFIHIYFDIYTYIYILIYYLPAFTVTRKKEKKTAWNTR